MSIESSLVVETTTSDVAPSGRLAWITGSRSLAASLIAVTAAMSIALGQLSMLRVSVKFGILCVIVAGVSAAIAIASNSAARRNGIILPMTFVTLWTIGYGVSGIAWTRPRDVQFVLSNGLRYESLPSAFALAGAGILFWTVGFVAIRLRLLTLLVSSLSAWATRGATMRTVDYRIGRIAAIYLIGVVGRLGLLAIGRYAYITADLDSAINVSSPIGAVLLQVEFFAVVGLILLAFVTFRSPSPSRHTMLLAAIATETAFGLLSGLRSSVLLKLLAVGLVYVLVRHRIPKSAVIILALSIAFLTPFTSAYRDEVRGDTGTQVTASEAAELLPQLSRSTVDELTPRAILTAPSDFLTQRLRLIDEVGIVVQRTPNEIGYVPPLDTIGEATGVLIPRVVWQDKPVYTTGLSYARDYWNQSTSTFSARSPTLLGDSYLRGGLITTMIILALVGAVMASLNRALSPRQNPVAAPMFVNVWISLALLEEPIVTKAASLVQVLLVTAVVMRWAISVRSVESLEIDEP